MNHIRKTMKGFSLIEVLISLVILVIMTGAFLLSNNSQKKAQEVQLATRTLAAQLRLMQNDVLNGKIIDGKKICGIKMYFNTNGKDNEYQIKYYDQCPYDDSTESKATETFELKKSQFDPETTAGGSVSFLPPFGVIDLSLAGESKGIVLESKNSDQQMVVCINDAGNIEEIKGDDRYCVGAGMCTPSANWSDTENCSATECGTSGHFQRICEATCGATCEGGASNGETDFNGSVCNAPPCCVPDCFNENLGVMQECGIDSVCGVSCGTCLDPLLGCSPNGLCATLIDNCQKLQNMPKNSDSVSELVADIDCEETNTWPQGFIPIGTYKGKFYGNDKTINNLHIKQSGENRGLFFNIEPGAEVRDLNLDVHVKMPPNSSRTVGGLAGTNSGTIRKVSITGSIEGSQYRAGGVAAMNMSGGQIIDSKSTATMKDLGGGHAGCLVGTNNGSISGSSTNCSIECNMNCGGLVGFNGYDHYAGSIKNSNASGPVIGMTNALGGLVGINYVEGSIDSNSWWSKTGTGRPNACGVGNGTDPLSCTSPQGK